MEPWSLCSVQHGSSSLSWHGNVTIVKMVIVEHVMVHKAFAGNRSTRCGIDESQLLVILSNWTREAIRSGSVSMLQIDSATTTLRLYGRHETSPGPFERSLACHYPSATG